MAGPRASQLRDLAFAPGVVTNLTDRDAIGHWKASNRVRWHKGMAEKLGGWARQLLTGFNNGLMVGTVRALHDWSTLSGQQYIAAGSECKLMLVNKGKLYDITPVRKTSNVSDPFTTTNGSPLVLVSDPNHRARTGDHLRITSSTSVGGLTLSGDYDIAVIVSPTQYRITAATAASSGAVGGGATTIEYDVGCGLAINGELRGYGTYLYGAEEYGNARPVGQGVPAKMRTWSLQNWGEDLLAAPSDGELYWWDKGSGPNSRAVLVPEAPTDIQRMLVNPENRYVILIGCSGLDGIPDPMRVRWCEQEDFSIWTPTDTNTAGGKRLDYGSRLITGIKSRTQNYVWSDEQMYAMPYVGPPLVFSFDPLGACKIVGPNVPVDVNGIVFFVVFDDFMIYDGTLRVLDCDIHTSIFGDEDRNIEGDFDRTQAESMFGASFMAKNEVTWFYLNVSGTGSYVTFNYKEGCWYRGTMTRTAYHDVSEAITGYKTNPYGVNVGRLYKHEVGFDEVDGASSVPQAWFMESFDNHLAGSDAVMLINTVVPNFDRISGSMLVTLKKKYRPRDVSYQIRGPFEIDGATLDFNPRTKASQIVLRIESAGELGEDFRMGLWQVDPVPYGGRIGRNDVIVGPGAPTLTGEVVLHS